MSGYLPEPWAPSMTTSRSAFHHSMAGLLLDSGQADHYPSGGAEKCGVPGGPCERRPLLCQPQHGRKLPCSPSAQHHD